MRMFRNGGHHHNDLAAVQLWRSHCGIKRCVWYAPAAFLSTKVPAYVSQSGSGNSCLAHDAILPIQSGVDGNDVVRGCAGGTFALFRSFLPAKCNIQTTFVDISDLSAVENAMTSRTKVSWKLGAVTPLSLFVNYMSRVIACMQ